MTPENKKNVYSSLETSWRQCLDEIEYQLSEEDVNTWLLSLQPRLKDDALVLLAPNAYVLDWVKKNALKKIKEFFVEQEGNAIEVIVEVGSFDEDKPNYKRANRKQKKLPFYLPGGNSNKNYCFDNFVEGKSNQMALAMAKNVASGCGAISHNNPLFLYGGVGLGKTHLLNAIGNEMLKTNPKAKVVYIQSENFVSGMVQAIKSGFINEFKKFYRSLDAILVDDIQLFMKKTQTQEEFFHTFNSLFEKGNSIVLTCDRYPKKLTGVEERLRSRFGCGLIQEIYPPELETRVAILVKKSEEMALVLPHDVAFFIASHARGNVRELEGALRRVAACAGLVKSEKISVKLAKNALRDLLASNQVSRSTENIQATVAEFYRIRVSDMVSPQRNSAIVRARQVAISLAKELTNLSLARIGSAFGGRNHATVMYSLRKIKELQKKDLNLQEEYKTLLRILDN